MSDAIIKGLFLLVLASVGAGAQIESISFGEDVRLLQSQTETLVLADGEAMIAVSSDYQGRVMTSTFGGFSGPSLGWFNRKLIKQSIGVAQTGAVGGEDRLWFGPEFGKFSVFFRPGVPMIAENISAPSIMATDAYALVAKTKKTAVFEKEIKLINYIGTEFSFHASREISLLSRQEIESALDLKLSKDLAAVAFQSANTITNQDSDWSEEKGLISIWILGCFPPAANVTIVIPLSGSVDSISSYWTSVGSERLKIIGDKVFYLGDGAHLHKIGIAPQIATPVFGSYNPDTEVLTIIEFSFAGDTIYVNSKWRDQQDPFAGDVVNVFNDGPIGDDGPFGPFYELETSSPAKALAKGESLSHTHTTFHFSGPDSALDEMATQLLGVGLEQITKALNP